MLPLLVFQDLSSETVVRATRESDRATDTAADVVVVTREELEATNERSLPRQLAEAAGVWVQETNLGGGSPIIQGIMAAEGGHMIPSQGAVPIIRNGVVVGACGVGGGTSQQDEDVARAAVAKL